MKIKRPNETGSTTCTIRWMAETPHGWVGAWDREALAALAEQEERIRLLEAEKESIHRNSIRVIERLRLELAEAERLRACRDELREATEAADDPEISNSITLSDAIRKLHADLQTCRNKLKESGRWKLREENKRLSAEVEHLRAKVESARAAERERCARICESLRLMSDKPTHDELDCATAIRREEKR